MRLTVNLDPEAYNFATIYAGSKGITLSAALNELLHRAEQAPHPKDYPGLQWNEYGYLEIAATGHVLTPEMVKEFSEDELV